MRPLIIILFALTFLSCSQSKEKVTATGDSTYYTEKYRPQFHFSPAVNWTNDPNGLVYYDGEYHLFYQYNPYGTIWGHMSWGHAVSKDLLHWEHLPVAISEYQDAVTNDSTMIFSGTVVVDKNNTSGLCDGKDCLVAIYTSHVHKNGQGLVQHQSLAYSNDKGRTWRRYDKNPILDIKRKDFRDPKVFWYEPLKAWIMLLVIPDLFKVKFYKSDNLKEWSEVGEFGNIGDTARIWECPDMYELPVTNEPGKKKWVLSLSGSHPAGPGFVGMQYFVGEFNGTSFVADDPHQVPLYVDYGKDFYAGIVFNNIPKEDGRTIMIGWANNWTYGNQIPTSPWRSAMSIPRELSLKKTDAGIRLIQNPIKEIQTLRGKEIDFTKIPGSMPSKAAELEVEIDGSKGKESGVIISGSGAAGGTEQAMIGYNSVTQEVFIDRVHSGDTSFNKEFSSIDHVKVKPTDGKIKLHIFIDHSIIEVFANDGEQTLCEQFFSKSEHLHLVPFRTDTIGTVKIKGWKIDSVWKRLQ
jgi:fructan beta-fructosidase